MVISGGRTCYGANIGILMMKTKFPRIPGDPGNAATFPFPVSYRVVPDLFPAGRVPADAEELLLREFSEAARELEAEGCGAVTTVCGFLAGFQKELAEAVRIPVFTSPLSLVPWIATLIGSDRSIGIFSDNAAMMNEELFGRLGWSSRQYPVTVSALPQDSEFHRMVIEDRRSGDIDLIREEVLAMTGEHMKAHPDTGAIILECANYAAFQREIAGKAGVPVYSINQLIFMMHDSLETEPGRRW